MKTTSSDLPTFHNSPLKKAAQNSENMVNSATVMSTGRNFSLDGVKLFYCTYKFNVTANELIYLLL